MEVRRKLRQLVAKALRLEPVPETRPSGVALTIRVEQDEDDGGYVASIVGIPGVMSQGDSEDEAIENVLDALTCVLQAEFPRESRGSDPATHQGPHTHDLLLPA